MDKNLLAVAVFSLAASIVYASTPSASAQSTNPTAICTISRGATQKSLTAQEEWMNEQIAAGRTHFASAGSVGGVVVTGMFCAW